VNGTAGVGLDKEAPNAARSKAGLEARGISIRNPAGKGRSTENEKYYLCCLDYLVIGTQLLPGCVCSVPLLWRLHTYKQFGDALVYDWLSGLSIGCRPCIYCHCRLKIYVVVGFVVDKYVNSGNRMRPSLKRVDKSRGIGRCGIETNSSGDGLPTTNPQEVLTLWRCRQSH